MRRLTLCTKNELHLRMAGILQSATVLAGSSCTYMSRRRMCAATPQRLDNSLSDGNILFSFEGELELLELQKHSAGLFASQETSIKHPSVPSPAPSTSREEAVLSPSLPAPAHCTPQAKQAQNNPKSDARVALLAQSYAHFKRVQQRQQQQQQQQQTRNKVLPSAKDAYVEKALDLSDTLHALPTSTTALQKFQQLLSSVHCDALLVMLEDALVRGKSSVPVLRALLANLEAQKGQMKPKQVVYASVLLLNAALNQPLAAEAHVLIVQMLYAHARSAQGYVALRFLQILTRVPRPLNKGDTVVSTLRSSVLNSCLGRQVQSTPRKYAAHLGGLQVTQVIQETVTLCSQEMDPLVLQAALEWLAARRQVERRGRVKPLPSYLHMLLIELRNRNGIPRGGQLRAAERLQQRIQETKHFAVRTCDEGLSPEILAGARVDTSSSINDLLRQLPQLQRAAYLNAMARVLQFVLRCSTMEEVDDVARAVAEQAPSLCSYLFERFLVIVLTSNRHKGKGNTVQPPTASPLAIMNVLLKHCDTLEATRALLWQLRRCAATEKEEANGFSPSSFLSACHKSVSAYTAVSLIPVVLEQYVLENDTSLFASAPDALLFLRALTRFLPAALFCAERTVKAIEAVVSMERSTSTTSLTMSGRLKTSHARYQEPLQHLTSLITLMRNHHGELQKAGEHITAVFGSHPSVFHWLSMEDVAHQPDTRGALREYCHAGHVMSDWKSECALCTLVSKRQQRHQPKKRVEFSVVGRQMVQFGELLAEEDTLPSSMRRELAGLRARAAALPSPMRRIEEQVNWRHLTRTWIHFFVSILWREKRNRQSGIVSSVAGAATSTQAEADEEEEALRAVRSEMCRTMTLPTEAVDCLVHYLLIPSRIYVRPYHIPPTAGAAPSPELRLHTAMADSLLLADRMASIPSSCEAWPLQSFLTTVAFPLLYSYAHYLRVQDPGASAVETHVSAATLESWTRWVQNALWISSLDLIQLYGQRSGSDIKVRLASVEDLARSYLVVLSSYRQEGSPAGRVDKLLPQHHSLVLEEVLMSASVSEEMVHAILAELERVFLERKEESFPPLSPRAQEVLLMAYVTRGDGVPLYLRQTVSE